MHFKMKQKAPSTINPVDFIYMRSSEMYLIEAKAMMTIVSGEQAALLPRASERDSAYDVTVFSSQSSLMEHIKFQRRLELWGEGFGYTDKTGWEGRYRPCY